MPEKQSNDTLKGRIAANRQIIAHCENEIRQLEGVLQHRGETDMTNIKYKAGDKVTIVLDADDVDNFNRRYNAEICLNQIISHEPAPEPIVGFVNVYETMIGNVMHTSKQKADVCKSESRRLSCLKITYDPATKSASVEVVG